ncbi:YdcF family protein [soil metagenome]
MLRGLLRFLLSIASILATAWIVVVVAIFIYGRRDLPRPADAIVVLGAAQYDGRPSPVLRSRLDHALELYRRGTAPRLILTGGTAPGDTVSEAVVSGRYLIRSGVPPEAVLTEQAGERSVQSLASVARMMRERNLRSAVLVSDRFHMLRLRLLAARFGIRVYPSPTPSSPIAANPREEWRHVLRESVSVPLALVEGADGYFRSVLH